jgi:hypothetical protein
MSLQQGLVEELARVLVAAANRAERAASGNENGLNARALASRPKPEKEGTGGSITDADPPTA